MSKEFYGALGKTTTWPEVPGLVASGITFADVLLIQQLSSIEHRGEVNLTTIFGPYTLEVPIITAPMDTVSGERMIREMHRLGGIGTLPRGEASTNLGICERLSGENIPAVYAIGLEGAIDQAKMFQERGAKIILIDIANGAMEKVIRAAGEIKNRFGLTVIAGNITTYDLAKEYKKAGIDMARVGVGSGGACDTRQVSGVGFAQLSAVFETTSAGIYTISDGGTREPGDVAKAIAGDAQMVMIGSMFAATDEAPGEVIDGKKVFRGQASQSYMDDHGTLIDENRAAEGITTSLPLRGPVEPIVNKIKAGLRSSMSYTGAHNIKEFQKKAIFGVAPLATQNESKPWILNQK